jgi:hypothetical protein
LSFNRGLISPKALARVDVERTRLSAESYENWMPATQGSMSIRPGTKFFGSSLNDTGAEFLEFVASTDDVALPELTHQKMRIWLGADAHALALLSRPKVDTTVSVSDTGWANASTGGAFATAAVDQIPQMTSATTNGVTVSASSENTVGAAGGGETDPDATISGAAAYQAADDNVGTNWQDTGAGGSRLPSWWKVNFGAGNTKAIRSYSVRAGSIAGHLNNAPTAWTLQYNDVDTGAGWTTVDSRSAQTAWALSEKRSFTRPDADTGTIEAFRYWRLNFTAVDGDTELIVAEIEMFTADVAQQVKRSNGIMTLNASSIGALAKATKRVIVSDTGTEHSLALAVSRGPVILRVGSTAGDDDYISEAALGTGYHNLAFTPTGNFHITLQTDAIIDRIVQSIAIGDSGTVEITAPWDRNDLDNVRYDQSADVVYVDCDGVRPSKIERRGTGRSWSVVDYAPDNGPFLSSASSSATLYVNQRFGNTTLRSTVPFFRAGHVGALLRIFTNGQTGVWRLGAFLAATEVVKVTGLSDTGTPNTTNERRIVVSGSGVWAGNIEIQKSFDGPDLGFRPALGFTDTGTFTETIDDKDSNIAVWYRAVLTGYSSGVAVVTITYLGGGVTGVARITGYNSNTSVDIEVLSRFSDTGTSAATNNWQQGYWSDARGFPTAIALHGGRLAHAQGGSLFLSVSDDYENFDDTAEGDAGPIIRTLGSGPVDAIRFLISKLRLIIGTAGAELALTSSSLDEPVTPDNSAARTFSTQGSGNLRALPLDDKALHVQRSNKRVHLIGPTQSAFGDYESSDLTLLVPDLLAAGIVSVAVQRQPDTRLHVVLGDGTVAILTYEPKEEVVCWTTWVSDTGTNPAVERAMVLPGEDEDAVYYHVRRTINGATKRYLEKWATQSECVGDSGLTWLMDCAASYTDTGRTTLLNAVAPHLIGESVVAWGSLDTGSTPHVDLSPDVSGVQTRYTVDTGGDVQLTGLTDGVHHAVAGLPFRQPTWKSAKLAYGAEMGTALAQQKRTPQLALALYQTHNNGVFYGDDTGTVDPLPRVIEGATIDPDQILGALDMTAVAIPNQWGPDSRIVLRGKSPRPATILAMVPTVVTSER